MFKCFGWSTKKHVKRNKLSNSSGAWWACPTLGGLGGLVPLVVLVAGGGAWMAPVGPGGGNPAGGGRGGRQDEQDDENTVHCICMEPNHFKSNFKALYASI